MEEIKELIKEKIMLIMEESVDGDQKYAFDADKAAAEAVLTLITAIEHIEYMEGENYD